MKKKPKKEIPDITNQGVKKFTLDEERDYVSKILLRYQRGVGANELNRRNHTADLEFIWGADQQTQWDPVVLQLRAGRPSYTFNRCLQPVNLLIGDQRQTRPAAKVRAAAENATPAIAEIFGGIWRSIEQESRADAIYDDAYKQCVGGGYGEIQLMPQYEPGKSFDQVLRIINIPNPLTVVRDPECTDPCGADAMWTLVGDRISKEKYEELYPDFDPTSFPMARDSFGWRTDGMIRVVDYFERFATDIEIAELSDGRVVDWDEKQKAVEAHIAKTPGATHATVVRTRKVKTWKIRWLKCDGSQILEGPIEYDWQRIPVVRMPGRYINIEGRQLLQSFVRHAWDAQRGYNFMRSDSIERSALGVKAPIMYTPKMVNGFDDQWANAHITPRVGLPFNVDKDAATTPGGGAPYRIQPVDPPAASTSMAQMASMDIQATLGMFDPALGNADDMNRVSGKALVTHTKRSDLGSHEFIDGYGKALQLLCECGMDMIPKVYDSKRVLRIIGGDGTESQVPVNTPGPGGDIINDLKAGRYDCTVTLGPSYQTARQESLATLIDAASSIPAFAQVTPDLIARAIDSPDSEEMYKRLHALLIKQGIVQPSGPQDTPPPQQPDPMQQAELARAQALAARDTASAQIEQGKAAVGGVEVHKLIAETAGKHLSNLLAAQKLGEPAAAAQAEANAAPQTASPT